MLQNALGGDYDLLTDEEARRELKALSKRMSNRLEQRDTFWNTAPDQQPERHTRSVKPGRDACAQSNYEHHSARKFLIQLAQKSDSLNFNKLRISVAGLIYDCNDFSDYVSNGS